MTQPGQTKRKFPRDVRNKCLLWCARHCCLCGKNCGLDIELHHLEDKLPPDRLNEIANAMPVCYHCHADLERSKANSPRGSKYIIEEQKFRRDQIYEEHTRHLVPVLDYGPFQDEITKFPSVRFRMHNTDGALCVYAKCRVEIYVDRNLFGTPLRHYAGDKAWACNPGLLARGVFDLSKGDHLAKDSKYIGPDPGNPQGKEVRIKVHLTIVDSLGREHHRLPVEWFYDQSREAWVFDP